MLALVLFMYSNTKIIRLKKMGKTARGNRHGIEQIHLYQFADTKLVAALKLKPILCQYNIIMFAGLIQAVLASVLFTHSSTKPIQCRN